MNGYRLLVFDWDGTLMDSQARIVACFQAAADDVGVAIPDSDRARDVIGLGLQEATERLFPDLDEGRVARVIDRYRYHFLGDHPTPLELFPGVVATLEGLAEEGYLLGIATGKSRRGLDKVLRETGLWGLFHASRCADEAFSKPHPQMLEEVMAMLGAGTRDTLMIGDTEYDMQMARNAGVPGLAVSYGVHSPRRLLAEGALACLDRIDQLPGWLAGHGWPPSFLPSEALK
jgi:phosphoglycolate phosphatase